MVYVLDKNDPLNCELKHPDWSKVSYGAIPKATYPENGLYNRAENISVTLDCDCEQSTPKDDNVTVNSEAEAKKAERYAKTPPTNASLKVIVPAYSYPSSTKQLWGKDLQVAGEGKYVPYIVINPDDGSGSSANNDYARYIDKVEATGVKVLGYISSDETRASIDYMMKQAKNYCDFYGEDKIDGFFIDEMQLSNKGMGIEYYNTLYKKLKAQYPSMTIIANPGTSVANYISDINAPNMPYDIICTYENTAEHFLNATLDSSQKNSRKVFAIAHTANPTQYEAIIDKAIQNGVAYIYITDDVMPNPYDGMATDFQNYATVTIPVKSGGA